MKRREFIALLSGAAAWPVVARAQQSERTRRIGVLSSLAETDVEAQAWDAAFRKPALWRLASATRRDGASMNEDDVQIRAVSVGGGAK